MMHVWRNLVIDFSVVMLTAAIDARGAVYRNKMK